MHREAISKLYSCLKKKHQTVKVKSRLRFMHNYAHALCDNPIGRSHYYYYIVLCMVEVPVCSFIIVYICRVIYNLICRSKQHHHHPDSSVKITSQIAGSWFFFLLSHTPGLRLFSFSLTRVLT